MTGGVAGNGIRHTEHHRAGWIETEFRDLLEPLVERHPDLQARQVRPDAAVDAEAERRVAVFLAVENDVIPSSPRPTIFATGYFERPAIRS